MENKQICDVPSAVYGIVINFSRVQESSKEKQVGFEASLGFKEASLKVEADCKTTSKEEAKVTVEAKVEPGFTKLAYLEENTIDPPNSIGLESDKTRVYLTVYYLDEEGNREYPSVNVSYKRGYSCIISAKGSIVESRYESDIWLDRTGFNHKTQDRKEKINTGLKILRDIANTINCSSEDKEKINLNAKDISRKYRKLEGETNNVIRNVEIYGNGILTAIEKLTKVLKDSDNTVKEALDDLQWEVNESKSLKESLEKLREGYPVLVDDLEDFKGILQRMENKAPPYIDVIISLITNAKVHSSIKGTGTLDNIVKEFEGIIEDLNELERKLIETERAKAKAEELTKDDMMLVEKLVQRAKELLRICNKFIK